MQIISDLKDLKCGKIIADADLKEYTSYKTEGTVLAIVFPESISQLMRVIEYVRKNKIKHKMLGNGSNLVFDSRYEGILIKLSAFDDLEIKENIIQVGAGYPLVKLAMKAARTGLTGMEFAAGIPGTVGGAIFMNAGAYQSDMGYVVREVTVLTPNLEIKKMSNQEMQFHYRTSFLQHHPGYICLGATLVLRVGTKEAIMEVINDRKERRVTSQPLDKPSAGSVFRNPSNDSAWRLVEEIGYKGHQIGGAKVSEKHANFVINVGGATGNDIKKLILEIQEKVKEKTGIELTIEQEFVE